MKLSPESLQLVEAVLDEYLKRPEARDAEFAQRHRALPLSDGWFGTTYLTTSGEFWYRSSADDPPRIESDLNERSKLVALVLAAERHPQLAALLPVRPDVAVDCDECRGRGWITIADVSTIICGMCSGLGWRTATAARADDAGSYPSFDQALAQFRTFAGQHGSGTDLVFLDAAHALLIGDHLYVTTEAEQTEAAARQTYARAVARRLGVAIGAIGELPDRRLGAFIYGPGTESEAERLMYPNGLKMTIPESPIPIRVVGNVKMRWLRFLHRSSSSSRTREYFR